jgi:Cupin-like domain
VARVSGVDVGIFLSRYLKKNQPVIVTDAMGEWRALKVWTPDFFATHFGSERVQVYGDLFRLVAITTLADYLTHYFGPTSSAERRDTGSIPYVRWYSHLVDDDRVPWADDVFLRLQNDWTRPYFFPAESFVLPYCGPSETIDPSRDWFPARGLFISGKGARTRLHVDPWCSDALLCQIYGEKEFVMYDPSQAPYLTNDGMTVDVEAPDLQRFPRFPSARAAVGDALQPGETLFVPAGWFHHFRCASDSISLTWNFVHMCRLREFLSYVTAGLPETEFKQLSYAYFGSPGRRSLDNLDLLSALTKLSNV